jgi:hypothetical protein
MRSTDFLQRCADDVRAAVPAKYAGFETLNRSFLLKIFYGSPGGPAPGVHYEVWLRNNGFVEIGLHFEAAKQTNDRLLRYFSDHALDVISQLGPQVEVEQWTKSWGRVHQSLPYTAPNEHLLSVVSKRMAAMITVLQPMLDEVGVAETTAEET